MPSAASRLRVFGRVAGFLSPYRKMLWLYLGAMAAAAAASLAVPKAAGAFVDRAMQDQAHLLWSTAAILAVGGFLAAASALRFGVITWIGERLVADIRQKVFAHILKLSPVFFESRRTGEILSRLTSDVATLEAVLTSSFSIAARSLVIVSGCLAMMLWTNLKLTLLVLVVVPLLLWTARVMGRRVRGLSRAVQDMVGQASAEVEEALAAIRMVQAYTLEKDFEGKFSQTVEKGFALSAKRIRSRALLLAVIALAVFAAVALVVFLGGRDVLLGRLTPGEITAFLLYAALGAISWASVAEVWGSIQEAAGATERLFELLDEKSAVTDPPQPLPLPAGGGEVVLQKVRFRYPARPEREVLQGIDLVARPGEKVAVVGPSGAGKSTLFALMLRFYDPDSGAIFLDGAPISLLPLASLRGAMAIVTQDPAVFSATAAENIAMGRPGASRDEIIEAARAAQAHDFIAALPQGYDTPVGERGVMLSGGQRQRLAIARAFLRSPRVLLLDEATSQLDAESERLVQEALDVLMRGRTVFVIAHRLATVQGADRIVVLDGGRVAEEGSHESLLARGGLYAHLAALQFLTTAAKERAASS